MSLLRRLSITLALLAAASFAAPPAQASQIHQFSKSFTLPGSASPLELDINQSTGEVYVSSFGGVVDVFEASGAPDSVHPELTKADGTTPFPFSSAYGVAVDNTVAGLERGDIYVADNSAGAVLQFNPSGARTAQAPITAASVAPNGTAQSGSLPAVVNNGGLTPTGVTVASNGDVYVSDQSNNVVDIFEPSGVFVAQIGAGHLGGPYGLALDSHGNLYVAVYGVGVVEFDASGACVNSCTPIGGSSLGVAVDSEGHVYNDEVNAITEFNSSAEKTDSFGSFSFGRGVAVNDAGGNVYVADELSGTVNIFEPLTVPTVTTGPASNILTGRSPSATLAGQVVPDGGEVTSCYFEVNGVQSYEIELTSGKQFDGNTPDERTVPCSPAPPYSSATNVSVNLSSLLVGTDYHYRLVASSGGHTNYGQVQTFRVPGLPIGNFSAQPSTTQAGGHPNIKTEFEYADARGLGRPTPCLCQNPHTITNLLPTGVIGNPHATPYCTLAQIGTDSCPPDSQVGTIWTLFNSGDFFSPLYNVEPDPDQAGLLGFQFPFTSSPAFIELSARTGSDYGLDATLLSVPQTVTPEGSIVTLWGVPADPSHNAYRVSFGATCSDALEPSESSGPPCSGSPTPSSSPRIPFLENPTACGESLTTGLEVLGYDTGISIAEIPYPETTGCDQLSFNPSLSAQPTTTAADTPSGLEVDLSVPQQQSPEAPSPSEIRATTVKLPNGFSINPGAADGKSDCTDAEARLGTPEEAQCPETSKVGTVTLDSSALPGSIPGFVYLLAPQTGNRYRILLSANGFATHVKLVGSVTPDPQTGQLTTSFPDLPQSPFSDFNIHFFGSERGLLATPTQCGRYSVQSTFTPWAAVLPKQSSTQFFNVTSGPSGAPCPGSIRPFDPGLQASSLDSTAGAHSPFSLELTRSDGDQYLSSLNVTTPPGFLATLKGISYCSDAALATAARPSYSGLQEQANPTCPSTSEIGESVAGAGAGNHPVYLPGKVYLAGPYKGAPLSLAVITPAVSGPYDLGNVVVRAALHVSPATAQITAVSDPLPQILEGIPLRLRSIRINLNRPNFVLNPTNCDPFAVDSQITGDQGTVASISSHFQVANCASLPFAPKLSLRVSGGTKRSKNPALKATLTSGPGEANIASTSVTLPHSEFLDNAHIRNPCTRVVFAEGSTPGERCPSGSVIGFAKAETPLLDKPLEGPVYLRSSSHKLPDIVAALKGQIDIELDGRVDSVHERLRTTFETVPDAPVSKFTLSLDGGKKGLLENSENLCAAPQKATVKMGGQNGKQTNVNTPLAVPCHVKAKKTHRANKSQRAH